MSDVIILGLDGATWDIIDPLVEAGRLPNIADLIKSSNTGELESTFPPITGPAWLAMGTGQNPGKTGVYYFLKRTDPYGLEFESIGAEDFQDKSLWDVLNARGYSVGVFNYPMCFPSYEVDGFMVSGMGSPEDATITYPESLRETLDSVTGGYQVKVPYADPKYAHNPDGLANDLKAMVETREAAIDHLLTERDPDVFFGVVSATDWVQHYFWRYFDESHVDYDTAEDAYRNVIPALWERVDETVGMVAEKAAEDDAILLLVSDHGFGPTDWTFRINEYLEQQGLLTTSDQSWTEKIGTRYFPYMEAFGKRLIAHIPQLNGLATSVGKSVRASTDDWVDWDQSIAVAPKQNLTCGVLYLLSDNKEDRRRVVEALESIPEEVDEKLDVSVYLPEDIYTGPKTELAPDVLFEIDGFRCAVDPRYQNADTVLENSPPSPARSGGHRRDGIYAVSGPGVDSEDGSLASLLDIAPTVLHALDEPIPTEMDGNPLTDAFLREFNSNRRVRRQPLADLVADVDREAGSPDGVRKQLSDLGYL